LAKFREGKQATAGEEADPCGMTTRMTTTRMMTARMPMFV
jgi:hypothetical protein